MVVEPFAASKNHYPNRPTKLAKAGDSVKMQTPTPMTNRARFLESAVAGASTERHPIIYSLEVLSKRTSSNCLQPTVQPPVAEIELLDTLDGVPLLAHRVDLITRAVGGARVGHGVAVVPG